MKIKNMALIMACFLIFISMSCICACDNAHITNTGDADNVFVDDVIDDGIIDMDDCDSSIADGSVDIDGGSSVADGSVDIDGGSSASSSINVNDRDFLINNMVKDVPKYNSEAISNVKEVQFDFGDFQDLINNLPSGTVLYLYNDYSMKDKKSTITISNDLTIEGNGHNIDACGKGRIFKVNGGKIVFKDLIITNGKSDYGGAFNVYSASSLEFYNTTFSNNFAKIYGGALYIDSTNLATFVNCSFIKNKVDYFDGGGIYSQSPLICKNCFFTQNIADCGAGLCALNTLTCENCEFTDNPGGESGAGAYQNSTSSSIFTNCSFEKNRIDSGYGGALGAQGVLTCTDCKFINNHVGYGSGGAISADVECTIINSVFINNDVTVSIAVSYGGAIRCNGLLTIESCKFYDNYADDNGGAIYANDSLKLCGDNVFIGNWAHDYAGVIYSLGDVYVNWDDNGKTIFKSNTAKTDDGGVIYSEKGVYVCNSNFKNNSADDAGGAIYARGNCTVKNSEFKKNIAAGSASSSHGGAIYSKDGMINVFSCKFSGNNASDYGGALYAKDSIILCGDNRLIGNWAHDFGGAIYSKKDVYIKWEENCKSIFKSNKAYSDSGGAIYAEKSVYVRNADFDSNFAEDDGGAIYSKGDAFINWDGDGKSIFKSNRANTDDGGAIYSQKKVNMKNADFESNYAHDGGAIYSNGKISVDSSNFTNNYAGHQGGAIYNKDYMTLSGYNNFTANEAKDSGGAIYTARFAENVTHATFKNNKAGDDGGAVYINRGNTVSFTECDFENNHAGDEGGAIYLDDKDSHLSLHHNNFVNNTAKSGYTVYNCGYYDLIKDNWHGSDSPVFNNQFKEWHLLRSDTVHTPTSFLKEKYPI